MVAPTEQPARTRMTIALIRTKHDETAGGDRNHLPCMPSRAARTLDSDKRQRAFRTPLLLGAIVAVGIALRAYRLEERALWFDEAFFWRLSQFPWREVVERTGNDNYPPLYPLLLKAWSAVLGCSTVALRSLSVLCGAATIIAAYLFCQEALRGEAKTVPRRTGPQHGRGAGLLASALVATSVFQIRWAWDAKMCALGAMLSVLSSWALLRALRKDTVSEWLAYAALAAAFLYTHYYALFSVFAQLAFMIVLLLRRSGWRLAALVAGPGGRHAAMSLAVISGCIAPWIPTFVNQHDRDRAVGLRPEVTVVKVGRTPFAMFCEPEDTTADDAVAFGVLFLSDIALFAVLIPFTAGASYTFLAAIVPFAVGIAVSLLDTAVYEVRYLVFSHPFWLIAAAIAISRVSHPTWRRLLACVLIASMVYTHARFCGRAGFDSRPGAKGAASFLSQRRRADEPIIVCSQLYYYPILYYLSNTDGVRLFDDQDKVRRHCWGSAIVQPHELISREDRNALKSRRVWVVNMAGGWGALRVPASPDWRWRSEHRFKGTWRYEGDYIVVEYENTLGRKSTTNNRN